MLTPPDELPEQVLAAALASGWALEIASIAYQAVGFGSHHWRVVDPAGTRWFVTVDDLATKQRTVAEPLDAAFGRLRASLVTARDVRESGRDFVLASVPTLEGEPLVRVTDRFAAAVYPFIDGQSFPWGEFESPAHRSSVLGLVVALHLTPLAIAAAALVEDDVIPYRGELQAALDGAGGTVSGPYARRTLRLLAEHRGPVQLLLRRHDQLVVESSRGPESLVLTHGEPHPGNTMLSADGWLLIDWDTALVAPPERDLWSLDAGDGSLLRDYADATGVTPLPAALELYRVRWDLADIALGVSRFRHSHSGSLDDEKSWVDLQASVEALGA